MCKGERKDLQQSQIDNEGGRGLVTSSYAIVIYRPKKGREWVKNGLGPW
jgi:hypothetical protein